MNTNLLKKAIISYINHSEKATTEELFMNRATLTLLTSCGSLAALLLMTNPADASPVVSQAANPVMSAPTAQPVNLHRANPMLDARAQKNPILDNLGCNCAACTKAILQMQGQFTL